ncbi:MAG: hypothetical protein IKP10_02360 [Clostridia bacterium]|nr:hypothetical protein [Clostridia bacterium]
MKTPLNSERLRQHFRYGWWKYAVALVLIVAGLNILFAITSPRPADNQKVELFVFGAAREDVFNVYLEDVRAKQFPKQEQFTASVYTELNAGQVGIGTRVMAGDGELFLLPEDLFRSYAQDGVLVALDEQPDVMAALRELGIPADSGRSIGWDDKTHLYGVNVSAMPVMASWLIDRSKDQYLCIRINNGNDETALQLFTWLLRDLRTPSPETLPAGNGN